MQYLIYIVLGIIQGFTEPLPISSSGHIYLFKNIFNTNMFNDLNFEIIANFGSFLAILFIFRKEIIDLIKAFFSYIFKKEEREKYKSKFKYCLLLMISTIPVGIVGIIFKDVIEDKLASSMYFLAGAFILTAIMLFLIRNKDGNKKDEDITFRDALIIGLLQMITIMPGISRSGTVLVACLLVGLRRDVALKYTFILYFPISLATMALGVSDLISSNITNLIIPYLGGLIASLIVTFFSYKWLSNIVKKGKLWKFAIYCLCLAIFIFIYFR